MVTLERLRQLSLFQNVSPDHVKRFVRSANVRTVHSGQMVFTAYDDRNRLYLLLRGCVKTFITSPNGMEQITHVFYPGDAFGGLIFGPDQDPGPWAEAIGEVNVVTLTDGQFKGLVESCSMVGLNLFNYMVYQHQQHVRRIQTLIHTRSSHRLVLTLLQMGDRQGDGDKDDFQIRHSFTHEDLGNMIGVVRSTVSELMGQLREIGVVTTNGRSITLHRRPAYHFLSCGQEECDATMVEGKCPIRREVPFPVEA